MKKILIIEDDLIIAHIYKNRLEKDGFEVDISADGQSGFYRIHEFFPDVLLLDLMLPKMNGLDILRKIRAESKFAKIPVVVFTNAYVPNMINDAFLAGASLVFNKATLTPKQIVDSLQGVLAGSIASERSVPKQTAPSDQPSNTQAGVDDSVGSEDCFHSADVVSEKQKIINETASSLVVAPTETQGEDAEFQSEVQRAFVQGIPEVLSALRKTMQDLSKAQDENSRVANLLEVYRKVHALTGSAGIAGLRNISKMAAAVEVLLKELYEKPKNINASTMRTVAHSADFLAELCAKGTEGDLIDENAIKLLVVDDEILSRRAITYALEKAGLKSTSVEEPHVALSLATEHTFDLIFLDVQMPGMDGFDLCSKIRALPTNRTTPIIFVTSLTDFKSRAKSTLSGGTDLIAKPFMFIELTVKALTHVLRGQLLRQNRSC